VRARSAEEAFNRAFEVLGLTDKNVRASAKMEVETEEPKILEEK